MKNYISGLLALMAVFFLFSFTQRTEEKSSTQALYWFEYNNGVVGQPISTSMITKEAAISETCPDEPGEVCARGYLLSENPGSSTNQHQEEIEKEEQ